MHDTMIYGVDKCLQAWLEIYGLITIVNVVVLGKLTKIFIMKLQNILQPYLAGIRLFFKLIRSVKNTFLCGGEIVLASITQ